MAVSTDGGEQAKKGGYTYWKRNIDDAHLLADNKPVKIDPQSAAEATPAPTSSVGSSWNAAGTWEEKDMSAAVRSTLSEILCEEGFVLYEAEGMKVTATNATVVGDSQAYNIRGRPRLGYELKVTAKWTGTVDGEEVSGDLSIDDLDSSDLDGVELRATGKSGHAASKRAADALKKGARPAIKRAAEELNKRLLGA
eukprot:TRINITY_DN32158_c0_g1_i1.p1 TRINITY_DN32158_c0_g1~~TRINITY_DN32158_c0_g1_i1.p1  ORF type:complete len:196 (-),score=57.63 TRINITY_DN32158_c0_g1_i1:141-728(-)